MNKPTILANVLFITCLLLVMGIIIIRPIVYPHKTLQPVVDNCCRVRGEGTANGTIYFVNNSFKNISTVDIFIGSNATHLFATIDLYYNGINNSLAISAFTITFFSYDFNQSFGPYTQLTCIYELWYHYYDWMPIAQSHLELTLLISFIQ